MPEAPREDDPIEEKFFSEPRLRYDDPADQVTDPRGEGAREAIEQAFVRSRRARFAKYVLGATCAAILVCAAALARTMIGETPATATSISTSSSAQLAEASATWSTPPEVAVQARQALEAARDALEREDHDAAITAAARSIALDPSTGKAWLLLGEAYDRAGRPDEARKAYRACLDEARTDADQCVAHLR